MCARKRITSAVSGKHGVPKKHLIDRDSEIPELHRERNLTRLRALVREGADVNVQNVIGDSPLHRQKNVETVRFLISAGANVNAIGGFGSTPLHRAFHPAVVFELLIAGADPNIKNELGELPEAHYGHSRLAEMMRKMVHEVRRRGKLAQKSWMSYRKEAKG